MSSHFVSTVKCLSLAIAALSLAACANYQASASKPTQSALAAQVSKIEATTNEIQPQKKLISKTPSPFQCTQNASDVWNCQLTVSAEKNATIQVTAPAKKAVKAEAVAPVTAKPVPASVTVKKPAPVLAKPMDTTSAVDKPTVAAAPAKVAIKATPVPASKPVVAKSTNTQVVKNNVFSCKAVHGHWKCLVTA